VANPSIEWIISVTAPVSDCACRSSGATARACSKERYQTAERRRGIPHRNTTTKIVGQQKQRPREGIPEGSYGTDHLRHGAGERLGLLLIGRNRTRLRVKKTQEFVMHSG